jgi:hypothetical protein
MSIVCAWVINFTVCNSFRCVCVRCKLITCLSQKHRCWTYLLLYAGSYITKKFTPTNLFLSTCNLGSHNHFSQACRQRILGGTAASVRASATTCRRRRLTWWRCYGRRWKRWAVETCKSRRLTWRSLGVFGTRAWWRSMPLLLVVEIGSSPRPWLVSI